MVMSLVWTIVSYVIGALLRMKQQQVDAQTETQHTLIRMARMQAGDTQHAREMQTPDTQMTRRIVMLVMTFSIMAVMLYGVFHGGTMIQPVLETTTPSGFFGMLFGKAGTVINFTELPLTVTVAYAWDLFGIMIGFYFGSGGTRR